MPILLRIALRSLVRRGRKNLVVAILIAVGVSAFFTGNAVLQSTVGGIQHAFSDNFTADLSISERSDQSFSIFGPDTPVIGEYESEPVLLNAGEIGDMVSRLPGVAGIAYVLSSPILLEAGGARDSAYGMGVIGDEYFSLFRGPRFIVGAPPAAGQSGWAVISEEWADRIAQAQGYPPEPGEKLQLSFFRNQTFNIREATLVGIIRYKPSNNALSSVVILDGRILRALSGYSQIAETSASAPDSSVPSPVTDSGVDSLFSGSASFSSEAQKSGQSPPVSINELRKLMQEVKHRGANAEVLPLGHDGAWHFILVRAERDANKSRLISTVRNLLERKGFSVQVRDWRRTAGAVAVYVYFMQIVLYVGLFMLGGIVLILTINSVVMSVFERTSEIGTMRAMGAQREFVRGLFILETSALSFLSGAAGVLLGSALILLLNTVQVSFSNQILVLLFGGTSLQPAITAQNVIVSLAASLVLGAFAWIYPVRLALRIQPVRAIHAA